MIKAVRDMVIIEPKYSDKASKSSKIVLPEGKTRKYHAENWGEVKAVGGGNDNGINPGDDVLYLRHEGQPVKIDKISEPLLSLKGRWVMAIKQEETVKPTRGRLLVQVLNTVPEKVGSIHLPDKAGDKYPCKGKVLAVGDEYIIKSTGERIPMEAKEGDTVYYKKFSGVEYEIDGEVCVFLTDEDVIGVETV